MPTRLERGLRIFVLLQQGVGYNAHELASKMGVSRRTIFRDMALLKEIGFPIAFDVNSARYWYDQNVNRSDCSFTTSDIEQILIMMGNVVRDGRLADPEEFIVAVRRFATCLPDAMQSNVLELLSRVPNEVAPSGTVKKIVGLGASDVQRIHEAIERRSLIRLTKRQSPLNGTCFEVMPQRLILAEEGWSLECIVFESNGTRTSSQFALNRFDIADLTEPSTQSISFE